MVHSTQEIRKALLKKQHLTNDKVHVACAENFRMRIKWSSPMKIGKKVHWKIGRKWHLQEKLNYLFVIAEVENQVTRALLCV